MKERTRHYRKDRAGFKNNQTGVIEMKNVIFSLKKKKTQWMGQKSKLDTAEEITEMKYRHEEIIQNSAQKERWKILKRNEI